MDWTEIVVTVDVKQLDTAADIAQMAVPYGFYMEDYSTMEQEVLDIAHIDLIDEELLQKDRSVGRIHIYISPEENPMEAVAFLQERLSAAGVPSRLDTNQVREDDWANNWKKFFKPVEIGKRLAVCPQWETYQNPENRAVLTIDPGMAFGTGTHETTRLCLEVMQDYVRQGQSVLDVGCGSGILAIGALLLGARDAVGVDIDEMAVKTAKENARINGVEQRFSAFQGNLTQKVEGSFDLIFANIVADVVILLLRDIPAFLKPSGRLVLSGIIDQREADVKQAVKEQGLTVVETRYERGWVAMVVKK